MMWVLTSAAVVVVAYRLHVLCALVDHSSTHVSAEDAAWCWQHQPFHLLLFSKSNLHLKPPSAFMPISICGKAAQRTRSITPAVVSVLGCLLLSDRSLSTCASAAYLITMQLTRHKAFTSASSQCSRRSSRVQRVTCRAQLREQQQQVQQQQSHTAGDLLKRTGAALLSGAVALSLLVPGRSLVGSVSEQCTQHLPLAGVTVWQLKQCP